MTHALTVILASLSIGQAHHEISRHYDPVNADGFRHYHVDRCRRVSRRVVDCGITLRDPVPGGSICQPNPDDPTEYVCETSPADSQLPPDTQVTLTLRIHNHHVWEVYD